MSASDDEEKCDHGREGDVVGRTGLEQESEMIVDNRHMKTEGRKSRNTTPLLGLKTTRLHS